jgi:hypothetical protein
MSVQKQAPNRLLDRIGNLAARHGLMAMGGLNTERNDHPCTIVLLGTASDFWVTFRDSAEYADGKPDPVDRWSTRVLPMLGMEVDAADVVYPFGGPPFEPFIAWAKATGEAFDSPTGMLVHATAGLMISYRGALVFEGHHPLPDKSSQSPCATCITRPCETACPVGALSPDHFYDVPTCKSYLHSSAGTDCMASGCAVRSACPVSQSFGRPAAQSALHMRAFKGES